MVFPLAVPHLTLPLQAAGISSWIGCNDGISELHYFCQGVHWENVRDVMKPVMGSARTFPWAGWHTAGTRWNLRLLKKNPKRVEKSLREALLSTACPHHFFASSLPLVKETSLFVLKNGKPYKICLPLSKVGWVHVQRSLFQTASSSLKVLPEDLFITCSWKEKLHLHVFLIV